MTNRVTLAQLCKMDATECASIPTEQLALLQDDLKVKQDDLKAIASKISAECQRRFSAEADAKRKAGGKDWGTVRVEIDGAEIVCDLPKKVEWNQSKMRDGIATLIAWGEDPAEYVKTELSVAEKNYEAWPKKIQAVFQPARTLGVGSAKFTIKIREDA